MTEPQIRELFAEMTGGEPPPSGVDPARARRWARARLHWRRAGLAATSAVAAAALAAAAVTGGQFWNSGGHQAAAAGPSAPHQFSPLVPYASFGWLPAGESTMQGNLHSTSVLLVGGSDSNNLAWELGVYAGGQCHMTGAKLDCGSGAESSGLRLNGQAPAVKGHRAFWAGLNLVWQYARDSWAELSVPVSTPSQLMRDTAAQRQAIKVADHVRFGAGSPSIAFVSQVNGLAGQWQVNDLHFTAESGRLQADSYVLTTAASRFLPNVGDLGVWANAAYIEIRPAPGGSTCGKFTENTHETIKGYQVVVQHYTVAHGTPAENLCAARADGLQVLLQEFGPHPTIDLVSLFKAHLRLLGTNPANWASTPIG